MLYLNCTGLQHALSSANGSSKGAHAISSNLSSSTRWEGASTGSSLSASQEESGVSSAVAEEGLLELGSFGAPHGVRGDIRLYPTTDSAKERLTQPGMRLLPRRCPLTNLEL